MFDVLLNGTVAIVCNACQLGKPGDLVVAQFIAHWTCSNKVLQAPLLQCLERTMAPFKGVH